MNRDKVSSNTSTGRTLAQLALLKKDDPPCLLQSKVISDTETDDPSSADDHISSFFHVLFITKKGALQVIARDGLPCLDSCV